MMTAQTCPARDQLRDYVRGEVDGTDLDRHLNECSACRQALDHIEDEANGLARLLRPTVSDDTPRDPLLAKLAARAKAMTATVESGQVIGEYELLEPIARG